MEIICHQPPSHLSLKHSERFFVIKKKTSRFFLVSRVTDPPSHDWLPEKGATRTTPALLWKVPTSVWRWRTKKRQSCSDRVTVEQCLYLGETSLFGFLQSKDASTLQQTAERQTLALTDCRHLPLGTQTTVDLVELKHTSFMLLDIVSMCWSSAPPAGHLDRKSCSHLTWMNVGNSQEDSYGASIAGFILIYTFY